ncbi:UNVERIFIED_CONTAM: hypothetical protein Slati_2499100 [Sesamum latifolium]|uniref:Uncharacterized protein n=1 Tax=Sesamum latifolium TaxID=2727402 RepID=A0AAW2WHN7_9LAMI
MKYLQASKSSSSSRPYLLKLNKLPSSSWQGFPRSSGKGFSSNTSWLGGKHQEPGQVELAKVNQKWHLLNRCVKKASYELKDDLVEGEHTA